ncbi:MAG: trypsin-like peptidase domain-containing protein [Cyanobacteria bacterium P01_F01_bin.53]
MLRLSGDDRKTLRKALTSSYRKYAALRIFVSDNFDFRLDDIATSQALRDAADDLIIEFEQKGDISNLIWALYQERPRNPEVQTLMQRLQGFIEQRWVLEPGEEATLAASPFELPKAYSDAQLEGFLPKPVSYNTDVGTLRRGLQWANAVCKVAFSDRPTTGTGVLIASDLVLTNYHVLSQTVVEVEQLADTAQTLLFEFGFVSQEHETPVVPDTFTVDATNPLIAASPPAKLDYALLKVDAKITTAAYNHIQPVPILSSLPDLKSEDGLNVLQHPAGNVMQVSLSASGVVQVDPARHRVWYVNRTKGGSSGSPCFNSDWQMVALHHASMSRGFGSVREGVLLSSIWVEIADKVRERA